jgi:tripartite-type tricarboxylate transporter receptor subunit TctC
MKPLVVAGALGVFLAGSAIAQQTYPNQTITFIVPFAAGGPSDVLARLFAQSFTKTLGRQVIVENVTGAGGTIGAVKVARAKPDGYTLLFSQVSGLAPIAAYYKEPPYDAARDFEPVARVADVPFIILTRKNAPVNNVKEFVQWVKSNDTKLNFGTGGVGSVSPGLVILNSALGTRVTGIAYRGTSLALQDLVAGNIDFMVDQPTSALGQIKSGAVKAIAVMSDRRSSALPDLPTAAEGGLANVEHNVWNGILAPKGTPRIIVERLYSSVTAAFNDEFVKQRMAALGAEQPVGDASKPGPFKAFIQVEISRWVPLMKGAGVVAE